MSFLCKRNYVTFDKNDSSPSPKLRKKLDPCDNLYLLPVNSAVPVKNIKRISLLGLLGASVKASMTVETALVLPLFCFFMIHMGSAIEMIRLHGNLEVALWNAGRQVGIYEEMLSDYKEDDDSEENTENRAEAILLSYTYIKNQIRKQLGEEYLEQAPLEDGMDGLQFLESKIQGDVYDLIVTYKVKSWAPVPGFRQFRMANRYYGHLWNGYEIPGTAENEEYVYVTEDSEVYHTNRECTHLRLSIYPVEVTEIPKGYEACEKCMNQEKQNFALTGNIYYICPEGGHYHNNANCPGLKRTVYSIPKSEVGDYRECSRCRMREENDKSGRADENNSGNISIMGKPA